MFITCILISLKIYMAQYLTFQNTKQLLPSPRSVIFEHGFSQLRNPNTGTHNKFSDYIVSAYLIAFTTVSPNARYIVIGGRFKSHQPLADNSPIFPEGGVLGYFQPVYPPHNVIFDDQIFELRHNAPINIKAVSGDSSSYDFDAGSIIGNITLIRGSPVRTIKYSDTVPPKVCTDPDSYTIVQTFKPTIYGG